MLEKGASISLKIFLEYEMKHKRLQINVSPAKKKAQYFCNSTPRLIIICVIRHLNKHLIHLIRTGYFSSIEIIIQ